jgi:chemotaxis protein CheC
MALAGLLAGSQRSGKALDDAGRDAITEVGNVLLNACLGAFSNLMKMNIKFTVPDLHVEQVQGVLRSVRIADEGIKNALLIRTRFGVRRSNVTGFLVILLGVTHLERLMEGLEKWSA